jgi:hypothetical protein
MNLDTLLNASALMQGAEATVALAVAISGSYFIVLKRRRPRARFAPNQIDRVSRSDRFRLSGIARNVEPGMLRLLCERPDDDGTTRYRDCGQIVLTGHEWQHRVSGSLGTLHEELTFLVVHVTPTAADVLRRQPEDATGAVLHELPFPDGCQTLARIDITIAFP